VLSFQLAERIATLLRTLEKQTEFVSALQLLSDYYSRLEAIGFRNRLSFLDLFHASTNSDERRTQRLEMDSIHSKFYSIPVSSMYLQLQAIKDVLSEFFTIDSSASAEIAIESIGKFDIMLR